MATRPLHFIWILDCSGSMSGEKIQVLNTAIREAIPHMRDVAEDNPNAQLLVRVLTFADGARWLVSQPTPITDFRWQNLDADGVTDMGKALTMVADQLKVPPMSERALRPVLALLTDGQPSDDYRSGLDALNSIPWGKKAVRVAIAIGSDADYEVLQQFIGPERKVLQANNPEALIKYIKWVSTAVVQNVSTPTRQAGTQTGADDPDVFDDLPLPPNPGPTPPPAPDPIDDVW
jgi:uncharacterized protein YegL